MPYSFSGRLNMPMLFLMLLADRVAFLWKLCSAAG
jgi:hypothetical protein